MVEETLGFVITIPLTEILNCEHTGPDNPPFYLNSKNMALEITPLPLIKDLQAHSMSVLMILIKDFILKLGDEKANVDIKSISHTYNSLQEQYTAIITYTIN